MPFTKIYFEEKTTLTDSGQISTITGNLEITYDRGDLRLVSIGVMKR